MELNELNQKARGGTELIAARIETFVPKELLDKFQIIHSRVRALDSNKKKILVLHDLPSDPEVQHLKNEGWKRFDKLVFVSSYQQHMYSLFLDVPFSAGIVIPNCIEMFPSHEKPNDTVNIIYHTTPHRGLNILAAAFEALSPIHPEAKLKVFSSFDLYGWGERDKVYEPLFERLQNMNNVEYSKSVSNEQIRHELMNSHIFAYPSIWEETSCLCLIEAMCAGLICVHPNFGALAETSMKMTAMYQFSENINVHLETFTAMLDAAISIVKTNASYNQLTLDPHRLQYVNIFNSIDIISDKWIQLLTKMSS